MGCKDEEEAAILLLCWEKHLLSGIWCHARFSRTDKVNWITGHPVSFSLITESQGELQTSYTFRRFVPKDQTSIQMEMSSSSHSSPTVSLYLPGGWRVPLGISHPFDFR